MIKSLIKFFTCGGDVPSELDEDTTKVVVDIQISECFLSCPCQHAITIVYDDGTKKHLGKLYFLDALKVLRKYGGPYEGAFMHYHDKKANSTTLLNYMMWTRSFGMI